MWLIVNIFAGKLEENYFIKTKVSLLCYVPWKIATPTESNDIRIRLYSISLYVDFEIRLTTIIV